MPLAERSLEDSAGSSTWNSAKWGLTNGCKTYTERRNSCRRSQKSGPQGFLKAVPSSHDDLHTDGVSVAANFHKFMQEKKAGRYPVYAPAEKELRPKTKLQLAKERELSMTGSFHSSRAIHGNCVGQRTKVERPIVRHLDSRDLRTFSIQAMGV